MDRAQKQRLVESLRRDLEGVGCLVVTHQSGLDVAEATRLRRQVRGAGARFRVTKNRLARRALAGGPFAGLSPLFTGPTAIAFSRDPVAAAKVVVEFRQPQYKADDRRRRTGRACDGRGRGQGIGQPAVARRIAQHADRAARRPGASGSRRYCRHRRGSSRASWRRYAESAVAAGEPSATGSAQSTT